MLLQRRLSLFDVIFYVLPQEMEEEELEALNDKTQMQYDFCCFIKDDLVPNAVKYYTGEAIEDDEEDYDDDEEVAYGFVVFVRKH